MPAPPPAILAVLVLYNTPPLQSPAFQVLTQALATDPAFARALHLLIADNSSQPQPLPPGTPAEYLHDGRNPGLARRYNHALNLARDTGIPWLLLLDQDTHLTPAFLKELLYLAGTLRDQPEIAILLPRLLIGDAIHSPHPPSHQPGAPIFDPQATGLAPHLLRGYNSGATLRVSSLTSIGGFPPEYPLDYLDHATMHRLQAAGGRIFLMQSSLQHDMSIYQPDRHLSPAYAARHRGQLAAEIRFYREHGSLAERLRHRIDLLRQATHAVRHNRWAETLRLLRASVARGGSRA